MQEVFEKIDAILQKYRKKWLEQPNTEPCKGLECKSNDCVDCLLCYLKDNINQVAEEYKQDLTKVKQESNQGWIPFKQREATEEEKEFYGEDCKYMLDCQLPEEDEEIFVTYRWKDGFYVGNDTFLKDGCECYLESGREFVTEAIAWQPLPEPYRGE